MDPRIFQSLYAGSSSPSRVGGDFVLVHYSALPGGLWPLKLKMVRIEILIKYIVVRINEDGFVAF
jgi:hypothetical protein